MQLDSNHITLTYTTCYDVSSQLFEPNMFALPVVIVSRAGLTLSSATVGELLRAVLARFFAKTLRNLLEMLIKK